MGFVDIFDNTPELYLVVIEAKNSSMDDDLWQCVAETATLYIFRNMLENQNAACGE